MIHPDHYTKKAIQNMSRFTWKKTWTFWPRYCWVARKRMKPFAPMYKGTRIIHGPGDALVLTRWISPEAYMFEQLRGNI